MVAIHTPGTSGIVVLVPEVGHLIADAHITLIDRIDQDGPLGAAELQEVADFFADVVPFRYLLAEECEFPTGERYLAPEPPAPFSHLAHGLRRLLHRPPTNPDRIELSVPHVRLPSGVEVPDLPVGAYADTAALVVFGDRLQITDTFPFGTAAA